MLDLQHKTESELCTSMTQAYSIYEYFSEDLEKEITIAKVKFEEIEIMAMIYCTLTSVLTLQQYGSYHGDIRP